MRAFFCHVLLVAKKTSINPEGRSSLPPAPAAAHAPANASAAAAAASASNPANRTAAPTGFTFDQAAATLLAGGEDTYLGRIS